MSTPPLSDILLQECHFQFENKWDVFAVQLAKWAADARDLETRLHQAELRLALLTEEG